MIFFSDLDNTLIFGKRWVSNENNIVGVEIKNKSEVAYMTSKGYALLKELSQNIHFIPTTARTIEQYNRIHIFKSSIKINYAVTTNGGNILINNKIDKTWQSKIDKKLKDSIKHDEGKAAAIKIIGMEKIKSIKSADGIYFYAVLNKDLDRDKLYELNEYFSPQGISIKSVRKKLYFIPYGIDKYEACAYLIDIIGETNYYSAGDSIMDENMLSNSIMGFIPASGGLIEEERKICSQNNIKISHKTGLESSEYILESLIEKNNSQSLDNMF